MNTIVDETFFFELNITAFVNAIFYWFRLMHIVMISSSQCMFNSVIGHCGEYCI